MEEGEGGGGAINTGGIQQQMAEEIELDAPHRFFRTHWRNLLVPSSCEWFQLVPNHSELFISATGERETPRKKPWGPIGHSSSKSSGHAASPPPLLLQ